MGSTWVLSEIIERGDWKRPIRLLTDCSLRSCDLKVVRAKVSKDNMSASQSLRSILGAYMDQGKAAEEIKSFLSNTSEDESQLGDLETFASRLLTLLENCFFSCLSSSQSSRSKCVQREKLWSSFHKLRLNEVDKLWQTFFSQHPNLKLGPCVYQHVNQKMYSDLVNSHFSAVMSVVNNDAVKVPDLTTNEENILRYAAGYVPFKLLRDREETFAIKSPGIVECLSAMAVNGEESSLLDYTRNWVLQINRGGLFEINDMTYSLFQEIEMKVRRHLLLQFHKVTADQRGSIISTIASDETIQFFWTILSVDIPDEKEAMDVLELIIGMWLNIRGFSLAGIWQDQYMRANKQASQRKKSLRKELKRKSEEATKTASNFVTEGSNTTASDVPQTKKKRVPKGCNSIPQARQGRASLSKKGTPRYLKKNVSSAVRHEKTPSLAENTSECQKNPSTKRATGHLQEMNLPPTNNLSNFNNDTSPSVTSTNSPLLLQLLKK